MKKFYTKVKVVDMDGGYSVTLDNKSIKTPVGELLVLPTKSLALAIASEWDDILPDEDINPIKMDLMCIASTAIDKVFPNYHEVLYNVSGYAMNDVLCYRCDIGKHLRNKQDEAWNKWIDWANEKLDIQLQVTKGLMPINQEDIVQVKAKQILNELSAFQLTVVADIASIFGSFVLAVAVIQGEINGSDALDISRVDELHQNNEWGIDEEMQLAHDTIKNDLLKSIEFLEYLK